MQSVVLLLPFNSKPIVLVPKLNDSQLLSVLYMCTNAALKDRQVNSITVKALGGHVFFFPRKIHQNNHPFKIISCADNNAAIMSFK